MLLDLVKQKVQDDSGRLTDNANFNPAIDGALERYSKHRPLETVEDLIGNGTNDLALPEWLAEGFSRVIAIEYPVDEIPEELLTAGTWKFYRHPEGLRLRLLEVKPAADETVRVTYTVLRREGDIPQGDLDAVACLAASICLRTLAAIYGQTSDPTLSVDVVNYRSKMDEFRRLADSLEERFNVHLGIDPKGGVAAASATAAPPRPTGRRSPLTH